MIHLKLQKIIFLSVCGDFHTMIGDYSKLILINWRQINMGLWSNSDIYSFEEIDLIVDTTDKRQKWQWILFSLR